ncbi:MAG: class I SAM-dependent methyltransferase [Gammaproteobacteria bacterium]|jgi:cyclopropane fatty-acyl-phospholipid synthase-like methyltransferase
MTKKSPAKKTAKKNKRLTRDPAKTKAARADRHLLYERAVQCVEAEIDFVDDTFKSLRGRKPTTLREDFCGTANTSCEWVRRRKDNRAWGIDLDPDVLAWGNTHRLAPLKPHQRERIEIIQDDVLTAKTPRVDAVLAMNFSYWIFHTREQMKAYFSKVRSCLTSEGVFFLDAYGGAESMTEMEEETDHGDFTYVWDQARYNPITGEFDCHIHFKFPDGSKMKHAFSYHWRLWTLPELRELLKEAGFKRVLVHWEGTDPDTDEGNGVFTATEIGEADSAFICYITAEK